jgi:adenine/guanine phosphoribosyltransferase-like PRPP-binding protein
MNDIEKKIIYLREEIEHRAIYRTRPGEFLPAKQPNTRYTWQFYLRRVLFDPCFVFTAAETLVSMLPTQDIQLCACEDAGVPLGLAMASVLDTPLLTVKKSRKAYGLLNFTEGRPTGKPLVLVDDLAGSQTTLRTGRSVLAAFNLPQAPFYVTLINKTRDTHDAYLKSRLISLFTCEDFALTWQDYVNKYGREPNFGAHY